MEKTMTLDRLTERAKLVLLDLPRKEKVSGTKLLEAIKKVSGMGNHLVQSIPGLRIAKTKSIDIKKLIKEAYFQSIKFGHTYVGTEHLLLALTKLTSSPDFNRVKLELLKQSAFPNNIRIGDKGHKTPLLDAFGEVLNTKTLRSLDKPLIYREIYESLVAALLLKNTPNVLLIGDTGVGKRTLVEYLARNITSLDVPPALAGYQVIEFDLLAFMTSLFNKGGIEFGLSQLSEELKSYGRVILFVKNFQNIFFAAAGGFTVPMFYSMFKSSVDFVNVRMVATLNSTIYEKILVESEHIIEDFAVIEVPEPTSVEILKILETTALRMGEFHNIDINLNVVGYIYKKAKEIENNVKFPQRGVDLMDHCCTYALLKKSRIPESYKKLVDESFDLLTSMDTDLEKGNYDKAINVRNKLKAFDTKLSSKEEKIFVSGKKFKLTVTDVDEAFHVFKDEKGESLDTINFNKLATLADEIKKRIIGQDEAVETVAKSLIRAKLGLRSKKRPLGNFLFLGPTGVGKTELAKVLSDTFFGEKSLIRLDMSDFGEKHNVARLVGAPPGYVGYGEGGELTTKIEARPDSVVLFDEIEKAHPDVLNILLQVMDEGELSDARGNVFDFSRAVVILTSNMGTEILHTKDIGFDEKKQNDKSIEARLRNNVKKIIKPELINRFDEIIIFKRLGEEIQLRVLDLLIKDVDAALDKQSIKLSVAKPVKEHILKLGYSEEYGARGLRRTLEKELLDKLAEYLLEDRNRPLGLLAEMEGNRIVIAKKPQKHVRLRNI
jgi:ATP-dependent Clp protease ATP-binding subunit ClpC